MSEQRLPEPKVLTPEQFAALRRVLDEVEVERRRQHVKWGEQNHPDGTDDLFGAARDKARAQCDRAARDGRCTWQHIAREEFFEALTETGREDLRGELVQLAAVVVAWIEAIDRRI